MGILTTDNLEALLQDFEFESEAEINQAEATAEIVSTRSLTPVLLASAPGCSSAIANGLSQQLIHQMNLISPNIMVSFDDLNVDLGPAAFPFLQPVAKEALRKAIADRGQPMRITSAYRTIAQQLFLYNRRNNAMGCGLTAVAPPGKSNHQSGIALDVADHQAWRPYLERQGWKWLGARIPSDPWHFDYVGSGVVDIRAMAVRAFQQLWNQNNPGDQIAEDGQWGNQTQSRLNKSPVRGFVIAPWDANPRTLKRSRPSMQGSDVQKLQQALISHGEGITADGDFGPATEAALKRVQAKLGLPPDGVAGPKTLARLIQQDSGSTTPAPAPAEPAAVNPAPATLAPVAAAEASAEPAVNITLRERQISLEVLELQNLLLAKGYLACKPDGNFGPMTKAAVEAFQRQAGLTVDGVAGPMTLKALRYAYQPVPLTVDTGLFTVDLVAKIFHGTPRGNIEKHLPLVLRALEKVGLGDRDMVLMALGTIRAETSGFVPISEGRSKYNTADGGRPFGLYDTRSDLGHSAVGDGEKYKGRGFVQLTGKYNYRKFSAELGLGDRLVNEPELANDPQIAADLLALFLKSKDAPIRVALLLKDYAKARWYVNGGSHGLDAFRSAFQTGLALVKGGNTSGAASGQERPVLRLTTPNMQGEWVRKVQAAIQADGIAITVDGIFGPATDRAVKQFQQKYGLGVDGVVGPKTLERLGI